MITTIENTQVDSAELLTNDVDARLTKFRPMSTPIDQISRFGTPRSVHSMKVGYYSVNMREFENTLDQEKAKKTIADDEEITIKVQNGKVFEISETLMIDGAVDNGNCPIIFYITAINGNNITLHPLNPPVDDSGAYFIPKLKSGAKVMRMGRAAAELDVQTGQYRTLPKKMENYCQIFKTQIEQSTLFTEASKEVGWSMSDQEEVAIYDMRLGMERSFLFGRKALINDPNKKCEVYFTDGIWLQAGKEEIYTNKTISTSEWTHIMAQAFTGHNSSKHKVLIGGTNLIERLCALTSDDNHRLLLPENKITRWGMDFSEMVTKFGTLYVIHSEVLDSCGHSNDGLIIDPEYLTKYVHTPFKAETLDLKSSGQRNTEAVVMTEISCLVLRHPQAHCRIIYKPATV